MSRAIRTPSAGPPPRRLRSGPAGLPRLQLSPARTRRGPRSVPAHHPALRFPASGTAGAPRWLGADVSAGSFTGTVQIDGWRALQKRVAFAKDRAERRSKGFGIPLPLLQSVGTSLISPSSPAPTRRRGVGRGSGCSPGTWGWGVGAGSLSGGFHKRALEQPLLAGGPTSGVGKSAGPGSHEGWEGTGGGPASGSPPHRAPPPGKRSIPKHKSIFCTVFVS